MVCEDKEEFMAKLIREEPENKYNERRQYWLVGDRFEVLIFLGDNRTSFFIDDIKNQIDCSALVEKMANELNLPEGEEIKLLLSIDMFGLGVPKKLKDAMFQLIESYLLELI